jgi:hypothetical protein
MLSPSAMPSRKRSSKHAKKHTNSEHDWAWVLHELASGKDAAKLTRTLASRRADKPNPLYYAQRTVDVASARLWLIEGVPIADVVTMLEIRRRFEIPAALRSARAWEIAQTAQRMIMRRTMRDLLRRKKSQRATAGTSRSLRKLRCSKLEKGGPRSAPWPTAGPIQICPSPPSTLISTPVM